MVLRQTICSNVGVYPIATGSRPRPWPERLGPRTCELANILLEAGQDEVGDLIWAVG